MNKTTLALLLIVIAAVLVSCSSPGAVDNSTDAETDSQTDQGNDSDSESVLPNDTEFATETETEQDTDLNDITLPLCDGTEEEKTRILIFGDSWATFFNQHETFQGIFEEAGCPNYGIVGDDIPGSLAEHWTTVLGRTKLSSSLNNNPDVDIVLFSLGGNDFLSKYKIDMNDAEKEEVFAEVRLHLFEIAQLILDDRDDIRIIIVGYDLPNFDESLNSSLGMKYYTDVGSPNAQEAAEAINLFEANTAWTLAQSNDRIVFVNNFGLMQWTFGNEKYDLEPYTVPFPTLDPPVNGAFYGGNHEIPSSPEAMWEGTGGDYVDAIHLSREGYLAIGKRVINTYLREWLLEDN